VKKSTEKGTEKWTGLVGGERGKEQKEFLSGGKGKKRLQDLTNLPPRAPNDQTPFTVFPQREVATGRGRDHNTVTVKDQVRERLRRGGRKRTSMGK